MTKYIQAAPFFLFYLTAFLWLGDLVSVSQSSNMHLISTSSTGFASMVFLYVTDAPWEMILILLFHLGPDL